MEIDRTTHRHHERVPRFLKDGSIKWWTVKQKMALVRIEIIQGKTTVSEASRSFDLAPSETAGWVEDAKGGMEDALRANLLDIRKQYEKQPKDLPEAYGEAMLELRARKSFGPCWMRRTGIDPSHPAGPPIRPDLATGVGLLDQPFAKPGTIMLGRIRDDLPAENEAWLDANGMKSEIHRKKPRGRPMSKRRSRANGRKSVARSKVEHVFGHQKDRMGCSSVSTRFVPPYRPRFQILAYVAMDVIFGVHEDGGFHATRGVHRSRKAPPVVCRAEAGHRRRGRRQRLDGVRCRPAA